MDVDARHPRPGRDRTGELGFHAGNLDRPGNREVQLDIFQDYRHNIGEYDAFQRYFRVHRPPTLVLWGTGDEVFGRGGAEAYLARLPDAEVQLLDTGHFALEEDLELIAGTMRRFLREHVREAVPTA